MVEDLNAQGSESVQPLVEFSSKYTLDIICGKHTLRFWMYFGWKRFSLFSDTALGVNLQDFDETTVKLYKKSIYEIGRVIVSRWLIIFT